MKRQITKKQIDFINAVSDDNIELVKILLKNKLVNPSYDRNSALRYTCEYGYFEIAKLLLSKDIDPSYSDNMPIVIASECGYFNIVKLLLADKRINPSAQHNWAIVLADEQDKLDIVELLWKYDVVKKSLKNDNLELYNKLSVKNKIESF